MGQKRGLDLSQKNHTRGAYDPLDRHDGQVGGQDDGGGFEKIFIRTSQSQRHQQSDTRTDKDPQTNPAAAARDGFPLDIHPNR